MHHRLGNIAASVAVLAAVGSGATLMSACTPAQVRAYVAAHKPVIKPTPTPTPTPTQAPMPVCDDTVTYDTPTMLVVPADGSTVTTSTPTIGVAACGPGADQLRSLSLVVTDSSSTNVYQANTNGNGGLVVGGVVPTPLAAGGYTITITGTAYAGGMVSPVSLGTSLFTVA